MKILLLIVLFVVGRRVTGEPVKFTKHTFENCRQGIVAGVITNCCLPKKFLEVPIQDFVPRRNSSKPLRVRKALQCLEGDELKTYTEKLQRGYELMRALPNDDPRSLYFQNLIHCSYGSGSLLQDGTNITTDIHFSWFLFPWHRFYLYFHERILQTLLDDPDFSVHYWNYDNSFTVSPPPGSEGGCFKAGHYIPHLYLDPTKSTFSPNRLPSSYVPMSIVDFATPIEVRNFPRLPNEVIIQKNRAAMHAAIISQGTTASTFLGKFWSVGDERTTFPRDTSVFGKVHVGIHFWVGGVMRSARGSASDPIFYAHHSNVDRIWTLWEHLGPGRKYPTDNPDWMDAEFLMWDEEGVLRRVKVRDSLSADAFGYTYQRAHDESWMNLESNEIMQATSEIAWSSELKTS